MVVYWIVGGMVLAVLGALGATVVYTHTYTVGVDVSIIGMVLIVLAGALMGAGAALLERHFRLALFGAVAGILSWGFLLGSLLSLAALLLLLGDRERFEA